MQTLHHIPLGGKNAREGSSFWDYFECACMTMMQKTPISWWKSHGLNQKCTFHSLYSCVKVFCLVFIYGAWDMAALSFFVRFFEAFVKSSFAVMFSALVLFDSSALLPKHTRLQEKIGLLLRIAIEILGLSVLVVPTRIAATETAQQNSCLFLLLFPLETNGLFSASTVWNVNVNTLYIL